MSESSENRKGLKIEGNKGKGYATHEEKEKGKIFFSNLVVIENKERNGKEKGQKESKLKGNINTTFGRWRKRQRKKGTKRKRWEKERN